MKPTEQQDKASPALGVAAGWAIARIIGAALMLPFAFLFIGGFGACLGFRQGAIEAWLIFRPDFRLPNPSAQPRAGK